MKLRQNGFATLMILFMTCCFSTAYAHDGHPTEDMIAQQLGNLGKVDFSISCDEVAQAAMNKGVAILHHMMYAQAELHFTQAIGKSPNCAMLYWGYAMTLFHPLWPDTISTEALDRGRKALETAQTLSATVREEDYLQAAHSYFQPQKDGRSRTQQWATAQQRVYRSYPDDLDAAAFYALSMLTVASRRDPEFTENRTAGELLSTILARSPEHPGAIHYSIHAYDNAALANLGVDSARAYDKIAPDVPHALHMPSHIFVRLGLWQDVVQWNLRSAQAALKYPAKGATSLHYVHAMDYLIYGYLQDGKADEALKASAHIASKYPLQNTFPAAYALAAIPARIALEQAHWQRASELELGAPDHISWEKFPQVEAITHFARGVGAARSGQVIQAQQSLEQLDRLYLKTQTKGAGWLPFVDAQRLTVKAWIAFEEQALDTALSLMRQAADLEDSTDKNPVTPGAVLPARELLADMLVLSQDPQQAVIEYQASLALNPNRLYSRLGVERAKTLIAQNLTQNR
ncbi:MAG: hypothetical protein ACRBBW_02845 [Cellvibrionaceae bacterium]